MAKTKLCDTERAATIKRLQGWMPRGSTVYVILRHVSRSGMQREIGLVSMQADGPRYHSHAAAALLGLRASKNRDAVKIGGCGMDMGFELVYQLATELYGDGQALRHEWL